MNRKTINSWKKKKIIGAVIMLVIMIQLISQIIANKDDISVRDEINSLSKQYCMELFEPEILFMLGEEDSSLFSANCLLDRYKQLMKDVDYENIPEYEWADIYNQNDTSVINNEIYDNHTADDLFDKVSMNDSNFIQNKQEELLAGVEEENRIAAFGKERIQPVRQIEYTMEQLSDPEYLRKEFFTIDAGTDIKNELLQTDKLLGYDVGDNNGMSHTILIYHTHSQEAFADSVSGDMSTSIMGVGEYLSEILKKKYGYNVIHHLGMYDVGGRTYAYSNAAKGLEQVLQDNPDIDIIIDLHRDEVKEGTKLVTDIDGKSMARFMFFNGMCYTRELGELTTLPNPYIQENIAFAFQMQLAAKEYFPGLTRKTYLKGYRYNMQYRPKSLLIELGAQTNTVEEAMNSCIPLAQIIDMVLRGEYRQ